MDFCLIFIPFGHYDEPEILLYENPSICPKGVDVTQNIHTISGSVIGGQDSGVCLRRHWLSTSFNDARQTVLSACVPTVIRM